MFIPMYTRASRTNKTQVYFIPIRTRARCRNNCLRSTCYVHLKPCPTNTDTIKLVLSLVFSLLLKCWDIHKKLGHVFTKKVWTFESLDILTVLWFWRMFYCYVSWRKLIQINVNNMAFPSLLGLVIGEKPNY